ncbi:MAG: hypothetical protein ACRDT0_14230 [Pseudonocardiaceae bacterium]
MSVVAMAQMLEGMPQPADLRRTEAGGQTVITVGARVVACFDAADLGMRNIAVVTLTATLGFSGRRVAEVMGLTPEYVSMLRGRARRRGSAGLVRARGRPAKLSDADIARAAAWRGGLASNHLGSDAPPLDIEGTYVLPSCPPASRIDAGEPYTFFTGALLDVLRNGIPDDVEYLTPKLVQAGRADAKAVG